MTFAAGFGFGAGFFFAFAAIFGFAAGFAFGAGFFFAFAATFGFAFAAGFFALRAAGFAFLFFAFAIVIKITNLVATYPAAGPTRTGMRMIPLLVLVSIAAAACGGDDGISSEEEARRAYFGLDESIGASITLGFAGFNAASSANITPQAQAGIAGGTLTVSGQVDQGSSANKGMRLRVGMVAYTDGVVVIDGKSTEIDIVYDTSTDGALQPALSMQLKGIPTGTLDGTLIGDYAMTGDLDGTATLNLTFTGKLMDAGAGKITRVPGMTHVTGTAVSGDGTYTVDITL